MLIEEARVIEQESEALEIFARNKSHQHSVKIVRDAISGQSKDASMVYATVKLQMECCENNRVWQKVEEARPWPGARDPYPIAG